MVVVEPCIEMKNREVLIIVHKMTLMLPVIPDKTGALRRRLYVGPIIVACWIRGVFSPQELSKERNPQNVEGGVGVVHSIGNVVLHPISFVGGDSERNGSYIVSGS